MQRNYAVHVYLFLADCEVITQYLFDSGSGLKGLDLTKKIVKTWER